jgi:hypothetical protein
MISSNIINVGLHLPTVLSFRHGGTKIFSLLGYEVVCVHLETIQNNQMLREYIHSIGLKKI